MFFFRGFDHKHMLKKLFFLIHFTYLTSQCQGNVILRWIHLCKRRVDTLSGSVFHWLKKPHCVDILNMNRAVSSLRAFHKKSCILGLLDLYRTFLLALLFCMAGSPKICLPDWEMCLKALFALFPYIPRLRKYLYYVTSTTKKNFFFKHPQITFKNLKCLKVL